MTYVSTSPRGPLVDISHARLRSWLDRSGLSGNEVARQAGISSQKFSLLLLGKVARCREEDRRELARILGVSIPYLRGDENAPHPRMEPEQLVPHPLVLGRPRDPATEAEPVVRDDDEESRAESELVPLLTMLDLVFPRDLSDPDVQASDLAAGPAPNNSMRQGVWSELHRYRIRAQGAVSVLDLQTMRSFVAGTAIDEPETTFAEEDRFAVNVAHVFGDILRPWLSGELPIPPDGTRLLAALGTIVTGLLEATVSGRIPEEDVFEAVVDSLERIAGTLTTLIYRHRKK